MYTPDHFRIQEYLPPEIYKARGDKGWALLNPNLLRTDDLLRKRYGPITINNWHAGGVYSQSGLRDYYHYGEFVDIENPTSEEKFQAMKNYFSSYSQHKFGGASDKKFSDVTVPEVIDDILNNPAQFPLIMSLELNTKTWLHTDHRNCRRIKTYKNPF